MHPTDVEKVYDLMVKIHKNLFTDATKDMNNKVGEVAKSLRSRSREMPPKVYSAGLGYTLLYLYSKAESEIYEKVKSELDKIIEGSGSIDRHRIFKDKEEKVGYAIYLYVVEWIMRNMLGFKEEKGILDMISELFKDSSKSSYINASRIIPYLLVVKRFCEAMYKA